jgi:hypothetical protein
MGRNRVPVPPPRDCYRSPRPRFLKNENTPSGCTRFCGAWGSDFAQPKENKHKTTGYVGQAARPPRGANPRHPFSDRRSLDGKWLNPGWHTDAERCRNLYSVAPSASPTRYAGAIRTWRSTPTLPHSITPRGRIRGRGRERSAW